MANISQRMAERRPGLVTFAAVAMFVAGAFGIVFALSEFANAAWLLSTTYGSFHGYLWIWGLIDTLIALVLIYAGYDILNRGTAGLMIGIIVAGLSAARWFFYLPAAPYLGIVMIAVDLLIIFGLTSNMEYFRAS